MMMNSTIRQGWQQVLRRFSIPASGDRLIVSNSTDQPIGLFGAFDTSLQTLSQVTNDPEILKQKSNIPTHLDIASVLETSPRSFPWVFLTNSFCTFGGSIHAQNLQAFATAEFKSGFCYMNLLIPLSFDIIDAHADSFRGFVEQLPDTLGAYPSLSMVLNVMLHAATRFPEIVASPVPTIAFDAESLQFHVTDKRGVPGMWNILKACRVYELLSLAADGIGCEYMLYPVGAAPQYSFWKKSMDHFISDRFVEFLAMQGLLASALEQDYKTHDARDALLTALQNAGYTNVVARERRFPNGHDPSTVWLNLNEAPISEKLTELKRYLLVGHRSDEIADITHNVHQHVFEVLKTMSVQFSKTTNAYNRARFEVNHEVIWNAEYGRSSQQNAELEALVLFLNRQSLEIENILRRTTSPVVVTNWQPDVPPAAPEISEGEPTHAVATPITEAPTHATPVEVVNLPPTRSYWAETLVGVLTAILGTIFALLTRALIRPKRLRRKSTFPWVSLDSGDEDDDHSGGGGGSPQTPGGQPPASPAPGTHQSRFSVQDIASDTSLLSVDLDEDTLSQYDETFQTIRRALFENSFGDILQNSARWISTLEAMALADGNAPYTLLAQYLNGIEEAYTNFRNTGHISRATLSGFFVLEDSLRAAGIAFGGTTPTQTIQNQSADSPARRWKTRFEQIACELGDASIKSLADLADIIDTERERGDLTQFDVLAASSISSLCRAVRIISDTTDPNTQLALVENATAMQNNINAILGTNVSIPFLSATRRLLITRRIQEAGAESRSGATPDTIQQLADAELAEIVSEANMFNEMAASQRDIANATREATIREHVLSPVNALANVGMAAAFFRSGGLRSRAFHPTMPTMPGSPAAIGRPMFQAFRGRGHRLNRR
ncbi:RNA2 polyprotein [Barley mild mosaic virus]|uniref:Genome polyprotein 2 n=3 Tax=Barley mild mosaic virus TaxID=12466 RepID=POL2_BAMMU|nr:RNA2 polyprotein [Barley mild mosaic virus]Q65657.1 RecName: Full=Genome polyprotein 2; Contains: RecName: Full=Helper component proteinase; Short=HC-pro; Contains: RecName: Full=70 kDa protein [Barley mild mosaic virus (strain UK-F)]CAA62412.1 RNA2 polyprotein [Barley mild mosaic virus]